MPEILKKSAVRHWSDLSVLLTDFDDTLTQNGRLPAACIAAVEKLEQSGLAIIIVTGRSAGWCDMMAKTLPVFAVIGENGAFYFRYDLKSKHYEQFYHCGEQERIYNAHKLSALKHEIFFRYPNLTLAADQPYRVFDLAIDAAEYCNPIGEDIASDIIELCCQHGATAKLSSIHINIWFGDYDKLAMTKVLFRKHFSASLKPGDYNAKVAFIGDSPNDEPMFKEFELTVGVANVSRFLNIMSDHPKFITAHEGGEGFIEFANYIVG